MKDAIKITGLMLRTEGNDIVVEVEFDGKWHEVIRESAEIHESVISHIIEPSGIRTAVERGYPFP